MVIVLGNIKGGVGKTMLSVNISAALAQKGEDVFLLDTDKQTSSGTWWQNRKDNYPGLAKVHNMNKRGELDETIEDLATRYKYIVVDIAGQGDSDELLSALQVCDTVLMPFRPSAADLHTVNTMDRIVRNARRNNKNLKAYCCLNSAETNPALVREIEMARAVINEYPDIPLLDTVIYNRVCFRDSYALGLGVTELDGKSASEESGRRELSGVMSEIIHGFC
ncbi:AAA family ATPase [Methylobacter luteus]|jgi:chromosome partitioning protein|uniref:AAA family ATPase n=1 Tax=Methylobacter luteus TaxID=415 RepID=UPI00041DC199|nr:AAA family ATPase [Methylobacter luteus]